MEVKTLCFKKEGEHQFLYTNVPHEDFMCMLDYIFDQGFKVTAITADEFWQQKDNTPENCHVIYTPDIKRFLVKAKQIA